MPFFFTVLNPSLSYYLHGQDERQKTGRFLANFILYTSEIVSCLYIYVPDFHNLLFVLASLRLSDKEVRMLTPSLP